MRAVLAAALIIATVVGTLSVTRSAHAKGLAFVITGGELGAYAHHFFVGPDDEGGLTELNAVAAAPDPVPSLVYDLYNSWGNFAVPVQMASGGPELRYYPKAGLLERRGENIWVTVTERGAAILDAAISEALAKKAAGELEAGAVAADFRARHLADVSAKYRFTTYPAEGLQYSSAAPDLNLRGSRQVAQIGGADSEQFILRGVVETVSRPPKAAAGAPPAFVITYSAQVGDTGYGGLLGFYSPPENRRPGRFWHDGYFYDKATPSYETTAGFDAMVARAVATPGTPATSTTESNSFPLAAIAAAVAATLTIIAIVAAVFRRRRASR